MTSVALCMAMTALPATAGEDASPDPTVATQAPAAVQTVTPIPAAEPVAAPTITSDKLDYPPGGTVTLTGAGWAADEAVNMVVNDTYGSSWRRDVTVTATPEGGITDVFNLPDWFVSDYDVTATGPISGTATTTFTDASGDFSIDFVAAAPYSYNHLTGGGAYDDRTVGTRSDIVESLEGGDFRCGDIVTYFAAVTVDDTLSAANDAPQTIEMDFSFLADTTGTSGVAMSDIVKVGVNYGPIQDLVAGENAIDDGIRDHGGSVATLTHEALVGTIFQKGAVLNGTVQLTDLERNEQVVVRIDVKLSCLPGSSPTGNLQADLQAARLTFVKGGTAVTPPAAIPGGAQTVPFKQIGDIAFSAIDVQKTVTTAGGTCPGTETLSVYAGAQVKYCYVVTNPSNVPPSRGAPLYNVTLTDDNGTPANASDDFTVTLTGLTDVDLDGTADDLAAGGSASGSALVTVSTLGTIVNTATAIGYDSIVEPTPYTDTDKASVTVTEPPGVAPVPRVIKGNAAGNDTVATLDEPGGSVTISVVVYNDATPGTGDATLTSLVDNVYGNITTTGHDGITATTCATGGTVVGGGSYSCSFTVSVTGEPRDIVDTVTATLQNTHSAVSASDQATIVVADVMPDITVDKTANPTSLPEPGGDVVFTVVVTNSSFEAVTLTSLTDDVYGDLAGQGTCATDGTIAARGTYTCAFTGAVTGEPGSYTDTVTAVAKDNDGSTDTASDDATVTITDVNPTLTVTKTANPTSVPETGGDVTFTFVVTNTSAEPVTITSLSDSDFDPLTGDDDCAVGTLLAAGTSCEFSITRWIEGDFSGDDHVNVFTAVAEDNDGTTATASDDATVDFTDVAPTILVDKVANPTSVPETGGDVTFTFTVTNTSTEEPVTITSLVDSAYGTLDGDDDCKAGTALAAGASCEFAIVRTLEGNAGTSHVNTFTAVAKDNDGTNATDDDDATVDFRDVAPTIEVTKTANPISVPETGGNVIFTFVVKNTSFGEPVTITSLSDSVYGTLAGDADCAVDTVLAAGASCEFSFTQWVEGDFSGPDHVDVFMAKAVDNDNTEATDTDDATVDFTDVAPAILVTKSASPTAVPETGGDVTFTFVVKNTSTEEPVTILNLSDSVYGPLAGDDDCMVGTVLAAGASCEFAFTEWVEGDFSGPDHVNVFTAVAEDNDGTDATDDDDATVDFTDVLPTILVTKTANPTSVPETGGDVTFTFTVQNTSTEESVTITSLVDSVYGPLAGDLDCAIGRVLPAGESCDFWITVWVEGDYSGPDHVDVFTAKAVDNDGTEATHSDDATVDFTDVAPAITVTKTANPTSVPETGGNVDFTFVVTNDSSEEPVTITSLSDSIYGALAGDDDCKVGTVLAAGASCEFSITRWVEGDYSGPDHVNVFTGKAVDNDNTEATDDDEETVALENVLPTIEVTKTPSRDSVPEIGADVTFTFVVKNTSAEEPVTITSLSDSVYGALAGDDDCKVGTVLAADASCEFSITRWVEGDYSGPDHVDVFTAKAVDNDGTEATGTDDATVDFNNVLPSVEVTKTADPAAVPETGGNVTFTFVVKNTSSEEPVTITSLSDSVYGTLAGEPGVCEVGTLLAAGAECTFSFTKWVEGDFSGPDHNNVFTGKAVDNDNTEATGTDDATVDFTNVMPTIEVTKTADPVAVPETGGNVTFTFVVKNTSSEEPVTITSLEDSVFGTLAGEPGVCEVGTVLAASASCTFALTEWVEGDYSGPDHVDLFTAKAVDNDNSEATDDDDAMVDFINVAPAIEVTKTANPIAVPETGGNVVFTFVVKNTSSEEPVTITSLSDSVYGTLVGDDDCKLTTVLAAGAECTFAFTAWVEGDFSGDDHVDVFTAKAVDNDNTEAMDDDDATVDFTDVAPAIEVTKTADPVAVPETGGDVLFTFVVKNTSTEEPVTITSLEDSVYGTLAGDDDCKVGTVLASGASCEFSFTQWVEGDFSGSDHVDVFTAKAVDNDNTEATGTDDATVDFTNVMPTIEVTKTADPVAVPETGGDVVFTFVVKNTSSEEPVTITSLYDSVYGTLDGDADCAVGTVLAASASCEFSFNRWVEGDYSGPDHVDVFTAKAVDNDNTEASDTDDATVDFTNVLPTIDVTKSASPTEVPETGGDVTFTFVVKNTSTEEPVTITSLSDSVYGTLAGDDDCKVGTVLAVGASCTFTFTAYVEGDYSGPDHVDVFTAKAVDDDNTEATDTDDATVDFTNVLPTIDVTKTANPTYVILPGGNVTFTFVVKNTSTEESVKITTLSDSIYGTLAGDSDCAVGVWLAAGSSCEFTLTKYVAGTTPGQEVNVFTATAVDNDKTEATDTDDATVDLLAPTSKIAPTQTTCQQYRDGTASDYDTLMYLVSKGKIGSVAPGVIYFWSTITVTSSGSHTLEGHQLNDSGTLAWRDMANLDVFLWDASCTKVQTVTLTKSPDGHPVLTVTGVPAGTYYFSVKYDTSSITGTSVSRPYPTVKYTFQTLLNGSLIVTSPDSVAVKPKK